MLSPKQEAFCMGYAKSGNATQAYKDAGYRPRNDDIAAAAATRMLRNVKVAARIAEISAQIESHKIMDVEEMQQRLTAFARMETTDSEGIAIKAMDLLGKMQGVYLQRQEIDINGSIPVVIRDDIAGDTS